MLQSVTSPDAQKNVDEDSYKVVIDYPFGDSTRCNTRNVDLGQVSEKLHAAVIDWNQGRKLKQGLRAQHDKFL